MNRRIRICILLIVGALFIWLLCISFNQQENIKKESIKGSSLEKSGENMFQNNEQEEKGKVIIKYLNEKGEPLANEENIQGPIGTQYQTSRKQINYYISNGYEPVNKIGDYKEEDITVIYYYKPVSETVSVENNNNDITIKVQNVLQDREYKLVLEQESTEGERLTGGKFTMVDAKNETELMNGTTTNGGLTLGAVNVSNEVDEQFEISEDKAPEGYLKAIRDDNKRFKMRLSKSYNEETNKYELKATSGDREFELEENDEEDEIIVKVVNEKIKTYDLAIKKYVTKIDDTETEGNADASINNEGIIEYSKRAQSITVSDAQKILYEFKIFNGGNETMDAPVVTDILPEGLEFLPESEINIENGWSLENGKLTTSKLVGKTIEGIDSSAQTGVKFETLQLEVQVNEGKIGTTVSSLTNTVSIPVDSKERNSENNTDTESVAFERKTSIYDLAIKKYATQISGEDTGRSVTAELNSFNQITYVESNPEKTLKNNQKIVYTFRVYNEGNKALKGTKITDIVPKGLKFDSNSTLNSQYGWEENNGNIETSYLLNRPEILGCKPYKGELPHYEELKVEFTLDEYDVPKENSTIVNEVRLAKAENETDDIDNRDFDEVSIERNEEYNFVVKKFASEVAGVETGRDVVAVINESNNIVYNVNKPQQEVHDKEKIVFTIRVFNEGIYARTGAKLTETIPNGLKFVEYEAGDGSINSQYNWVQNGNVLETNYLVGKTIDGSKLYKNETPKYIDLKVEFVVDVDDIQEEIETTQELTNVTTMEKVEDEINLEDNVDEDTVIIVLPDKVYDLVMKKFAYSINGEALDKEIVATVNDDGVITYENDNTITEVNKEQNVVFTLRIFNIGDQPIELKKVTDTLPHGAEYVTNSQINSTYNWVVEDSVATTDYLVGKTIPGFKPSEGNVPQYLDVKIECKITGDDLVENQILTNIARVEPDEKEGNTGNNEDTADVQVVPERVKVADLAVQKFLYSVDKEVLKDREIKAINQNGKIIFTKNNEIYKVANNQKLVFTLRIFNLGDGATLGREVIEYIPEGFDIVKDSEINKENGWIPCKEDKSGNLIEVEDIDKATVMKTDKLTTENIIGFNIDGNETPRYEDVQIELIVNEDEVKNEDRLVTNVAKIPSSTTEPDHNNDTSEETVKVKVFDLKIIKYIEQITLSDSQGDNTTHVGIENKGKIVKKEVDKKKINETRVTVVYGLKIQNIGEIAGCATEIYDYIPEDLKLQADDSSWTMDGQNAKYEGIAKKVIQPGETSTVEFKCIWDLSEDSLGERNNKAIISKYTNEYDAKDPTPDKDNEEPFIISIRTGVVETTIFIIAGIVVLSFIGLKVNNARVRSKNKNS